MSDDKRKLWKCLKLKGGKIISGYDNSLWKIGKWRKVPAPKEACIGLNASENIIDAIQFVSPDVIAEVEVKGVCIESGDKVTCEMMRILRVWKWEKADSVALAIFAARLCLKNFEKVYPNDNRPRLAIEAAEAYQQNPCESAASAARSAASAARSAASAAWSAAWSAASAARSAAWSAESAASAAWSAESAASAASASKENLHDFIVQHLERKETMK
jgi:hypothetical protein